MAVSATIAHGSRNSKSLHARSELFPTAVGTTFLTGTNSTPSIGQRSARQTILAAFIRKLRLKRVHLVGLSYGALTALVFAMRHPEAVRSMVLVEAPAHQLIRGTPEGEAIFQDFMRAREPVVEAFRRNDDGLALSIFNSNMGRDFNKMSPAVRNSMMQNVLALKAINWAPEPFPVLPASEIRKLGMPVLVVTGENTVQIHSRVDDELARVLPNVKRVKVPNAGHAVPRDNPQYFNRAVLTFLGGREQ